MFSPTLGRTPRGRLKMIAAFGATIALVLGGALVVLTSATAAVAATTCPVQEDFKEYKYSKMIPAQQEVKHQESRWYRTYSGPKEIFGATWTGTTPTRTPGVWGAVPASLNPPGANSIPANGTVSGGNYNLPQDSDLDTPGIQPWQYRYQTPNGGIQWYPSETGWATQAQFNNAANVDIGYSGNGWQVDDSRWVIDQAASPAKEIFYVTGGTTTDDNTDANWTEDVNPAGYTKIAERDSTRTVQGPCPPPQYGTCAATAGPTAVYEATAVSRGFSQTFQRDSGSLTWDGTGIVFNTPLGNDKITFGLTSSSFQIPLSQLTALAYTIDHLANGSIASQRLSFNVPVDVNGAAAGGFTTIVVEPVYNGMSYDGFQAGNAIVWSSNAIPGFPNRDTFKSWKFLLEQNPDAVLAGQILVNQGGGNAGLSDRLTSLTVGNLATCTTYTFQTDTRVTPVLSFTPGTCQAKGTVDATPTAQYTWTTSGPESARVYTAVPVPGVVLTQTTFRPYDLRQTNYRDPECQPEFTFVYECTANGLHVKLTFTNNSRWPRWPDYHFTGDGVVAKNAGSGDYYMAVRVEPGETKVIWDFTFPEDYNGKTVTIQYQDILGAERNIDTAKVELTLSTNCADDLVVDPPKPKVNAPTCQVGGSLGDLNGGVLDRAFAGPGTYTVTYTAPVGQVYATGKTVSYTLKVDPKLTGLVCGQLPNTGSDASVIGATGLALLALGGIGVAAGRIRRLGSLPTA